MRDALREIIEAGIHAPSGENAQPWKFHVSEKNEPVIDVSLDASADLSLYNWRSRASYVSLGAVTENICIASPAYGFTATVQPFPDGPTSDIVARIGLSRATAKPHELSTTVLERVTNRKPYRDDVVSQDDMRSLENSITDFSMITLRMTSDPTAKSALARCGAANEQVMLGNRKLHDFFFDHINWTKVEDERKRSGFFIETLELPPPARIGFKVVSKWSRASLLNRLLKFDRIVAAQNAAVYEKAGLFGILSAPAESSQNAFECGRAFERVWLYATSRKLSLQPLMGTLFLSLSVNAGTADLSHAEQKLIRDVSATITRTFDLGSRVPYAMFRLGRSDAPSARATRRPVDSFVTWNS